MDQPVLVNADVHERTEGRHVGDNAVEHHARAQVGDFLDPLREGGRLERRARVPAGLAQLGQNVQDGWQASGIIHKRGRINARELCPGRTHLSLGCGKDPAGD